MTAIMPAWCEPMRREPRNGAEPNGLGNGLIAEIPDEAGEAVEDREQRDEHHDVAQHRRVLRIGLNTTRSIAMPPTKEIATVATKAAQ